MICRHCEKELEGEPLICPECGEMRPTKDPPTRRGFMAGVLGAAAGLLIAKRKSFFVFDKTIELAEKAPDEEWDSVVMDWAYTSSCSSSAIMPEFFDVYDSKGNIVKPRNPKGWRKL